MRFVWRELTFDFTALEPVIFPRLIAGNVLRGALGILSRRVACTADCPGAPECPDRATCLYARFFDPAPAVSLPSGMVDIPKPFVFRARHLDASRMEAGGEFSFGLHVFTADPDIPAHLKETFASLEEHGLGPTRGRVILRNMTVQPRSCTLTPRETAPAKVQVDFLTPTELKSQGRLLDEPDFPALFRRIRDRITTLQTIYGEGPDFTDFRGIGKRAEQIRMTSCQIRTVGTTRTSTRTGQTHELGGFTGSAIYEGDLGEFLPWLEAAQYTGVGRQAVWGKGEIRVLAI